jgi:ribosome-associated protein
LKLKEKINSDKLSKFLANCMDDKKAEDIRIINLKKIENSVTDYFVLATGNSNIHIDAIADGVQKNVLKKYNERPWKKEGIENKEWILIDFVNVVAHIFDEKRRNMYELEKLWGDGIIKSYNSKK